MNRYIIGSLWDRVNRNGANKNFEYLFEGSLRVDSLNDRADSILNEAKQTNDMNENVQEQINTLVAESGTSDAEVLQARVDVDGNEYAVLKERLDEKDINFNAQLTNVKSDSIQRGINARSPFGTGLTPLRGDGTDETDALQALIDYAASSKIKEVVLTHGVYEITHIDMLTKAYNGVKLIGVGDVVIKQILPAERKMVGSFSQPSFARTQWADGLITIDAMGIGTNKTVEDYAVRDISIEGIHFVNDVENDKFDELTHQICATGVLNFTVKNCKFTGFLGDGICVAQGRDIGVSEKLQNQNVKIVDNIFDGVNKDNRQAVSIYNCDTFLIDRNEIKNTTRSNMPGAIDIEPGGNSYIARSGTISGNRIENCGGNVGAIAIVLTNGTGLEDNHNVITVKENTIIDSNKPFGVVTLGTITKNTFKNIKIRDNYVNNCQFFNVRNTNDVVIEYNYFENIGAADAETSSIRDSKNISISRNVFKGILNPQGIVVNTGSENVKIDENIFENVDAVAVTSNALAVTSLQRNNFMSTNNNGSSAFNTGLKDFRSISDMVIKDNIVGETFNSNTLDTGLLINGGSKQSQSSLPENFAFGETKIFTTVTLGGNNRLGLLETTKRYYDVGGALVAKQVFYPDSIVVKPVTRSAPSETAWSPWHTFDGVPFTT